MLTPFFLQEKISFEDMFLCDAEFYRKSEVHLILGKEAVGVEPSSREVILEGGNSVPYDTLLIATGSSPILPDIEGIRLPHVIGLRTLDDAGKIKGESEKAKDIVFLGGGLVSLHVLNALYRPDLRFTLVVASPHVLSLMVDEEGARVIEERLDAFGVRILKRCEAQRITRESVVLNDGAELCADLVIVGKGVKPNIGFLKGTEIQVNTGIVVDAFMRTSVEDIYAAGDVTEAKDPISNQWQLNPTWPNAIEQGKAAGLNMIGGKSRLTRHIRMNVSSLFGLTFASFGYVPGEGERVDVVRRDGPNYRKLIFRDHLFIGGILIGELDDAGILVNLVERRDLYMNLRADMLKGDGFRPHCQNFLPESSLRIKRCRTTNEIGGGEEDGQGFKH
jgi:NAD(P)H-nitrite reductase large subunit